IDGFRQLKVDQSEAEAMAILGPPAQAGEVDGARMLTWAKGGLTIVAHFRNDKLTKREAILDGLPLADEVAVTTPAGDPPAAAGDPLAPAGATRSKRYADIHERSRAYANHEPSPSAREGTWSTTGPSATAMAAGILV